MTEFILHLITVAMAALIFIGVFSIIDKYMRKRNKRWQYHITYEYKYYRCFHIKMGECLEELSKLGSEGWEIATCIANDTVASYLILKRKKLHTTKANGK